MIISKKKFERLVEDEVYKRLIEMEEKQKERKRIFELQERVDKVQCNVYALRDEFKKLVDCLIQGEDLNRLT